MSAPVDLPPPSGLGSGGPVPSVPPPPVAVAATAPARRRRGGRLLAYLLGALGVLGLAASLAFAVSADRSAQREHNTAQRWRSRSELQDRVIAETQGEQAEAVARAAQAESERDLLRAELGARTAEADQLRAALVATTEALVDTEDLLAEVAGTEAVARDRAALGG